MSYSRFASRCYSLDLIPAHPTPSFYHHVHFVCSVLLKCLDPILTIVCSLVYGGPFTESSSVTSQSSLSGSEFSARLEFSASVCSDHLALLRWVSTISVKAGTSFVLNCFEQQWEDTFSTVTKKVCLENLLTLLWLMSMIETTRVIIVNHNKSLEKVKQTDETKIERITKNTKKVLVSKVLNNNSL